MQQKVTLTGILALVAKVALSFAFFAIIMFLGPRLSVAQLLDAIRFALALPAMQWLMERSVPILALAIVILMIGVLMTFIYRSYKLFVNHYSRLNATGLTLLKLAVLWISTVCFELFVSGIVSLFNGQLPIFLEEFDLALPLIETLLFSILLYEVSRRFNERVLPPEDEKPELIGAV